MSRAEIGLSAFAAARATGARVIDVREPDEYAAGHVPGALLAPMARLAEVRAQLPPREPVYVICASGNRSRAAAAFLAQLGIPAYSVTGGTAAWARAGHPVAHGGGECLV
ncbi:MAG TPA: rhodanese-like domain-containing protein [Rugosimonospora sp.]|nr:rhodanese-like domain-containing protein [Rugosimonospora sp.]